MLCIILEISLKKGVPKLQIMGDSNIVIDWENKNIRVWDVRLEPFLRDISNTLLSFEWLSFNHIYRELNTKVITCPKKL
jgi:hypothetical protein